MSEFLSALRSGFGFLTTIPVGITMEGIERLMKHIYLFPVIGAVLGIILAAIAYGFSILFPPIIVSVVIIIAIYYLTGFNHIDGLADFGDGVAAHGTKEKKIAAMRDTAVGTGGILFCIVAIIGLFSSLFSIAENRSFLPYILPPALIVAETSAKQAMVTVAAFGRRLHQGFGAITVDNTRKSDFITGMIFSGIVCYLSLGVYGIEALIISQLAGLLVLNTANRHFGGVSGDVVGASNEIGRLAALLFIGGLAWMP
ncbi:adenosylcobinamide-GDP ribazoletransferase [Candidatus Methanoperedens nitratireducens]|uniref:Adenosylcobinamide-GDP ribazoletransferase n=1 Tax=Candidatus Methanoperedens nitratireducens TaxID=1392998 RepID=A0A284VM38_9EURY|nr:adenosylcobinamide-GDP ribazoletransferase [Candidatus Methanoperedens nitroreducens]SNQ60279.1 Cobalamin synthase [Candidatus Methanoperedens nitroreducens]